MNNISFKCSVSVYRKNGSTYSKTITSDDLNDLYEQRDAFIEKHKEGTERIVFQDVVITSTSTMENTSKIVKLIDGDYTNG